MRKAILIPTIIIVGTILVRFAINIVSGNIRAKMLSTYRPPEVTVERVKTTEINLSFETSGRVDSQNEIRIVPRVSGYLEKSYFKEGSFVKKGDVLFHIEANEYKNDADISLAEVNKLKAELEYANKQLQRAEELVKSDYIAKARYDELKSNRDSLLAQLNAAKSELNNKNKDLSYTLIKAPIDGKIGTVDVSVGNYVTPSTGALTTINSTDPMYIIFSLSSQDYSKLVSIDKNNNLNRKIEIYPNGSSKKYEYAGVQNYYDNKIDKSSGTVMLRADIKNPNNKLIHGEFVNVKIYSNNKTEVKIIPIVSVREDARGKRVYKVDKNNIAHEVYIKTNGQVGDNWIVTEGLEKEDVIVVNGVIKVIPDKPVKIVEETK